MPIFNSELWEKAKKNIKASDDLSLRIALCVNELSNSINLYTEYEYKQLFSTILRNKRRIFDSIVRYMEKEVSSEESQYIKFNFGYYRSKYLQSAFLPDCKVTHFDTSDNTAFLYHTETV